MVRGQEAKDYITQYIINNLGGFMNDKELRVQYLENGEPVQIKIALTAAKTNVEAPTSIGGGELIVNDKPVDIDYLSELISKYHLL